MRRILSFIILTTCSLLSANQYFCTAAKDEHFNNLLNSIGSLHKTNFEHLKEIVVFDLGLKEDQLELLNKTEKIKVYKTNITTLDEARPFVFKQALEMFPYVLWIDPGFISLNEMNDLFNYIKQKKTFLCMLPKSKSFKNLTDDVYIIDKFNLRSPGNKWILSQNPVVTSIVGLDKSMLAEISVPYYDISNELKSYNQSILSVLAYTKCLKILRTNFDKDEPVYLDIDSKTVPFYFTFDKYNSSDYKQFIVYKTAQFGCQAKELKFMYPKSNDWSLSLEFIKYLKEIFNFDVFIETGTYNGSTCSKAAIILDEIYSIELDPNFYKNCLDKFKDQPKIHLHLGDSKDVLKTILPSINKKILFYLDAHWSGDTIKGEENTPILGELKAIKETGIKNSVILVDDIRHFQNKYLSEIHLANGKNSGDANYPTLDELKQAILSINSDYKFFIYGDMAIAYLKTENVIPSKIIQAMSVMRLYEDYENDFIKLIDAENTISQAQGSEKDGIVGLMVIPGPELFTTHYRYWYGLTLMNDNKLDQAKEQFSKLKSLGFNKIKMKNI